MIRGTGMKQATDIKVVLTRHPCSYEADRLCVTRDGERGVYFDFGDEGIREVFGSNKGTLAVWLRDLIVETYVTESQAFLRTRRARLARAIRRGFDRAKREYSWTPEPRITVSMKEGAGVFDLMATISYYLSKALMPYDTPDFKLDLNEAGTSLYVTIPVSRGRHINLSLCPTSEEGSNDDVELIIELYDPA